MPYSTVFIERGTGVLQVGEGVVLGAEILAGALEARRIEEREGHLKYGLVDLTNVAELRIKPVDMALIANANCVLARATPEAVVAIVAPSDDLFRIAEVWQVFVEETGWRTRIFKSRDEADAWLRDTVSELG